MGWHRFFLSFATRPQLLQMNRGLFTSREIFLISKLHGQHVRAQSVSSRQHCFVVFLRIQLSLSFQPYVQSEPWAPFLLTGLRPFDDPYEHDDLGDHY
jgi:hypothetical protein